MVGIKTIYWMFRFLSRPDSEEYRLYRDLVVKIREEIQLSRRANPPQLTIPGPIPPQVQPQKRQSSSRTDEDEENSKKRRSRWGPQSDTSLPLPAVASITQVPGILNTIPVLPAPGVLRKHFSVEFRFIIRLCNMIN